MQFSNDPLRFVHNYAKYMSDDAVSQERNLCGLSRATKVAFNFYNLSLPKFLKKPLNKLIIPKPT
jgi:hypothetical protein